MTVHNLEMPPSTQKIRIFLVDDHEIVRRGLRDLLEFEDDIEVVGESGTAEEALELIPQLLPDIALIDVRLPDRSGIDVCREVRLRAPSVHTLVVTSFDDDEALFAAILAGASGYVLKQIGSGDLVDGIRSVAQGQSLIDPLLTAKVMDRVRRGQVRQGGERGGTKALLSEREREVLALIAEGLTNRQIGARMYLGETTVKNSVSSILSKLGLERRTQAAVLVAAQSSRHRF